MYCDFFFFSVSGGTNHTGDVDVLKKTVRVNYDTVGVDDLFLW